MDTVWYDGEIDDRFILQTLWSILLDLLDWTNDSKFVDLKNFPSCFTQFCRLKQSHLVQKHPTLNFNYSSFRLETSRNWLQMLQLDLHQTVKRRWERMPPWQLHRKFYVPQAAFDLINSDVIRSLQNIDCLPELFQLWGPFSETSLQTTCLNLNINNLCWLNRSSTVLHCS